MKLAMPLLFSWAVRKGVLEPFRKRTEKSSTNPCCAFRNQVYDYGDSSFNSSLRQGSHRDLRTCATVATSPSNAGGVFVAAKVVPGSREL
jgi:hypothetical protein